MKADYRLGLADGSSVHVQIDTTGAPNPAHVAYHQSAAWGSIRDEAAESIRHGERYAYHDGRRVHLCQSLAELARVTRRERAQWGVEWREDRAS